MSDDAFAEKAGLIQDLLVKEGLGFKPGMTRQEREDLDVDRQSLVLRLGWNKLSMAELRVFSSSTETEAKTRVAKAALAHFLYLPHREPHRRAIKLRFVLCVKFFRSSVCDRFRVRLAPHSIFVP